MEARFRTRRWPRRTAFRSAASHLYRNRGTAVAAGSESDWEPLPQGWKTVLLRIVPSRAKTVPHSLSHLLRIGRGCAICTVGVGEAEVSEGFRLGVPPATTSPSSSAKRCAYTRETREYTPYEGNGRKEVRGAWGRALRPFRHTTKRKPSEA